MSDRTTPAGNPGGDTTTSISAALAELPAKIRIHALAKLLGRSSREVLAAVTDLGADGRSVQSSIDKETALRVAETFGVTSEEPATEEAEESAGGPARRQVPPTPVFASASPLFLPPEPKAAQPPRKPEPRDEDEPDTETSDDTQDDDEAGEDSRPRRRRGRRGRGRGKGGQDEGGDEPGEDESAKPPEKAEKPEKPEPRRRGKAKAAEKAAEKAEEPEEQADEEQPDGDESDAASRRRRRRRRRKGGADDEGSPTEDDPPNTVVHVREAREDKDKGESDGRDEVRSVRGSTRLEAKRQRRRDGREAGRRRAPILSEAEFLARREAVDRAMVVRERGDRVQIGVLEDGVLVEHFVTSSGSGSLVGNVYLGRVQNVLPSMEAAFVDIGRGRNAVLYAGEVDWDAAGLEGKARKIEQALTTGDSVLVQVTKDPVGHKGARLTTQISLPGRFLVYVPGGGATGISRKLPENERRRLKDVLKRVVPEDAGVIIRTASEGISEDELARDVRRLQAQWQVIQDKTQGANGAKKVNAPALVYEEPDLLVKVVRDLFTEDFSALVVQGDTAWETVEAYVRHVAPELADRVRKHVANNDVFAEYRIEEQLLKALDRKVWLPSGGYLVIDRTEAMTVIDVNTGKFTGSGGNLEETVTRNNLESAEEIVRQLRLRDIGGIIVIDFIDMVLESNRDLVLRRLTECLGRDRTRHQVAEVTSLGLVQMTRKRVGTGLLEAFGTTCEHCKGRGVLVSTEPVGKPSNGQTAQHGSRRSRSREEAKEAKEAKEAAAKDAAAKEAAKAVRDIAAATTKANGSDQPDTLPTGDGATAPADDSPAAAPAASGASSTHRRRTRGGASAASTESDGRGTPDGVESPAASSLDDGSEAGRAAESSVAGPPTADPAAAGSSAADSADAVTEAGAPAATGAPTGTDTPTDTATSAGPGVSPGTSVPSDTGIPTDTEAPTGDGAPIETGAPTATVAPFGTDVPAGTEVPTGAGAPIETGAPARTGASPDTSIPSDSDVPVGTDAPSGTGVSSETDAPTGTGASSGTGVLASTDAPSDTGVPTGTDAPAGTSVPGVHRGTEAPSSTRMPTETGVPSGTDVPTGAAISAPAGADVPAGSGAPADAGVTSSGAAGTPASGDSSASAVAASEPAATAASDSAAAPSGSSASAVAESPTGATEAGAEHIPSRTRRRSQRSAGQPSVTATQAGASAAAASSPTAPAGEPEASTVLDASAGVPEQANGHTHGSDEEQLDVSAVSPPARRPSRRGASRPAGPPVSATHDG